MLAGGSLQQFDTPEAIYHRPANGFVAGFIGRPNRLLGQLIQGTNAKIQPDPITDMVSLPVPGYLNTGVAAFKAAQLDEAETCFKKLLHHLPDHAAGNFMLGLVYVNKGYADDGIELMDKALQACPWNRRWRDDLIRACEMAGRTEQAEKLKAQPQRRDPEGEETESAESLA